nr:mucin-5AC isoform X3 [Danio rerio]|eukprot:XP_021327917.1 mucin-5AC isoform X3 [Danio rerio]
MINVMMLCLSACRLPFLVVFLLFWMNAPGYAYLTYPNAGQWWGQPSDNAFLPLVVQSSVPESPVTGVVLEEVVSSLPKNRPKFNLLQAVKGGVSSSSDSTPQALSPNTPSSASLPVDQSGMSGLVSLQGSSGSSTSSGSGQLVFAQGEGGSFALKTGVTGQSTNDQSSPSPSSSASQGTTYGVITQAQGASQSAPGSSSPYTTISLPKYVTSQLITGPSSKQFTSVYGTQTGSSAPFTLKESTTYGGQIQTQDATSQLVVYESSTPYVSVSLPQVVTSPLTPVPSSKQVTSVYGTRTGSSAPFTLQRLLQGKGSTSQVVSVPSTPYIAVSLPQGVTSLSTPVSSSKQVTSVYTTQTGPSAPFTLQELLQGQDATSQFVSGSSSPYVAVSLPQVVTSQSAVPCSKQVTSVYGTQTGSSAPFTLQRLLQGKGSTSPLVSVPSTPYISVSLPQGVTSQSMTLPSSKQITSVYTTQTGSSAPFTFKESGTYGGQIQTQDATSKLVLASSTPYVSVSSPQVVTSHLTPVPGSKPVTSVYTTQTGSSVPFPLQGVLQGQDSTSQVVYGSSTPYVSVTLPQDVTSQLTPVPSSKQVTSVYTTQTGSSAPFTLQGVLQGQDATSQFVSGSLSPYVAFSLPQVVTSQSAVPSSKQITSVYGTRTGSSAPYTLQGSTYGGPIQPQNAKDVSSTGSSSSVLLTSTGDISNPSSSFSALKRYYSVKD